MKAFPIIHKTSILCSVCFTNLNQIQLLSKQGKLKIVFSDS